MFANEPFLKSILMMGLEGIQLRFADWKPKQVILTEESIYFFNKNDDITSAVPVAMKLIDTEAVYKGQSPYYKNKLPRCIEPYSVFIELRTKTKRRILTLSSKSKAKEWVKCINLYHVCIETVENCTPSAQNLLNKWALEKSGGIDASVCSNLAQKMGDGVVELDLRLVDEKIYTEVQKFVKGNKVKVGQIYGTKEKLEKVIELAGANKGNMLKEGKGKFDWDSELSNKNINVQAMLDFLFEIPKDTPKNKKEGEKIRNLKKLKALVANYMISNPHKARFVFEELPENYVAGPEEENIGTIIQKRTGGSKRSNSQDSDSTEYYYQHVVHKNPGLLTIEQLQNAMNNNDLFALDMLCKLFKRVGFEVPHEANQKLWQLKNEAYYVTTNLMKIINMDTEDDHELNDLLDICLSKAKNINMRGDLIDA